MYNGLTSNSAEFVVWYDSEIAHEYIAVHVLGSCRYAGPLRADPIPDADESSGRVNYSGVLPRLLTERLSITCIKERPRFFQVNRLLCGVVMEESGYCCHTRFCSCSEFNSGDELSSLTFKVSVYQSPQTFAGHYTLKSFLVFLNAFCLSNSANCQIPLCSEHK